MERFEVFLQLAELRSTERSPESAVEHQDRWACGGRQRSSGAVGCRQFEFGRFGSDLVGQGFSCDHGRRRHCQKDGKCSFVSQDPSSINFPRSNPCETGSLPGQKTKATTKDTSWRLRVALNLDLGSAGRNASWTKMATKLPSAAPKRTSDR